MQRALPTALLLLTLALGACAPQGGYDAPLTGERAGVSSHPPLAVQFLYSFNNDTTQPYFPFEGLAGLDWGDDGTLVVCDAGRGRVHSLDPRVRTWTTFQNPGVSGFRPLAARVDGFKVLVLDATSRAIYRYDLNGAYQDRIVDLVTLDPAFESSPRDFDLDLDGRVVLSDRGEQQILVLDSFLGLQNRVGHPGPHDEQFDQPAGVCFLPDGGFMVADAGNERLQRFNRLGYGQAAIGGRFVVPNPFMSPQGLDCDRHGNVFVADMLAGVVHVVGTNDRIVLTIGNEQSLEASLLAPVSVAVGPDQQLAVADRERQAILVFRVLYE